MDTANARRLALSQMTKTKPDNRFITGASYVVEGVKLIGKPRLRRFVVMPLLINIVVFGLGIFAVTHATEWAISLLPQWLQWLRWLLWPLFVIASLAVVFYTFSVVANIIASPFNGLLSGAVERHLRDEPRSNEPINWSAIYRELARTVVAELRKLLYFAMWAIPCLILFIIPGLNIAAPVIWFIFGAWMLAVEYVDCPLGNHQRPYPEVKQQLRQRRRLALGFGITTMLLTLVPVLNFIAMPVGVAGATALYLDHIAEDATSG